MLVQAGLPPVTLVWDRFDDLPHTLTALEAHDPDPGRITVHPTPGTDSVAAMAWDILAALGKPPAADLLPPPRHRRPGRSRPPGPWPARPRT